MQSKPETEKVVMIDGSPMVAVPFVPLANNAEAQRTRRILLIILGVCLAMSVLGLVGAFSETFTNDQTRGSGRRSRIGENVVSILFYSFGIIAAYKYYSIGLRVFACLGVVLLVLMGLGGIALLLALIGAASFLANSGTVEHGGSTAAAVSVAVVFLLIVYAAIFILTVVIVKFSFKLARLINANKQSIVGPV